MSKYLLLFILPFTLYASKILSYNIYERTDRADVMITFDTPFSGKISQSSANKSKIIIRLDDASIESPRVKKVSSAFLHSLTITPMKDEVQIVAESPSTVKLIASKTSDGYGLRLRFANEKSAKNANENSLIQKASQNPLAALPTKKDDEMSRSYYIVVAILIIGILVLLYLKRKVQTQNIDTTQKGWLFKSNEEASSETTTTPTQNNNNNSANVSIRFQKSINDSNSVVMLDFGVQSYLVLMGKSNILLDKFTDNKPTSQQEFESILQSRHEQLEDFLGESASENKEPLQAYKERAASLIYSEEA